MLPLRVLPPWNSQRHFILPRLHRPGEPFLHERPLRPGQRLQPRHDRLKRHRGRRRIVRGQHRRVVEIRDGLVPLAPYYDRPATADAPPGEGDEARWARAIRQALALKEATRDSPAVDADPIFVPGGADLESDARLLAGISLEMRRGMREAGPFTAAP